MTAETSLEAYNKVLLHLSETEEEILALIKASGDSGLTSYDLQLRGYGRSTASARLRGLALKGQVRASGQFGRSASGRRAIKWIIT